MGSFKRSITQYFSILLIIFTWSALISSAKASGQNDFQLLEADIHSIQQAFKNGTLSSETLTQAYLDRIDAYDKKGPAINSFIKLNPNAVKQARALDEERMSKGSRGLLHGIPIVIKDNYDTKDLPTTGGSVALINNQPEKDSFVVQRLRDAGAVILGKTNLSELALSYGRLGYSSVGGLTLNPYNLKRDASGSSSGSAAAIAANFGVIGTGTDTAGSIRGPANVTGLVGVKPTLGLTSRAGVIPASLSHDVTGPLARTVTDAAIALTIMAGVDKNDPRTLESQEWQVSDYTSFLDKDALKETRIGIARDEKGGNSEVDAAMERAIAKLRELGAKTVDVTYHRPLREAWSEMMGIIIDTEFRDQFEAYLKTTPKGVPKDLEGVIQISESDKIKNSKTPVNPGRIEGFKTALKSEGLASLDFIYIISNKVPASRNYLRKIYKDNDLDAIVFPTMLCPASNRYDKEDPDYICNVPDPYASCYVGSVTGFPEVTLPMGWTEHGLPIGLSFFGLPYSESRLLALAYAYEQATHFRKPPVNTPALDTGK